MLDVSHFVYAYRDSGSANQSFAEYRFVGDDACNERPGIYRFGRMDGSLGYTTRLIG